MRIVPALALVILASASPGIAADRLTDRDLEALLERIDEGRDRFEDALDDELKRSIFRGPSGEVDVGRFLDDFEANIDRLEERLTPGYSASSEAAVVLRQASSIDTFFRQQPPGRSGESEWNRLATDLKTLAAAYGTTFPLPEDAVVRRIGDRELAAALEEVSRDAGRLKKALDRELKKDTAIDEPTREAIVREADLLSKDARTLRGRVNDREPSSAEAERLLARAAKLDAFIRGHQATAAASGWPGLRTQLDAIANAYGMSWPVPRPS